MNIANKLLLLASIFCSTVLPIESTLTPNNTEINFDIDEVIIDKMGYWIYQAKIALGGIWQKPQNGVTYLGALLDLGQSYAKDESGNKRIYDQNGKKINGLTFQFLYHGIRNPQLTPYIPFLVETIESSRWFIPGTLKICKYLKEKKGYTINFATNKDHESYVRTAQAFGNEFTNIPTKVFVAHPGNDEVFLAQIKEFADLPTTPADYKKLAYASLTAQPTNIIFHAPSKKPELPYFQYMANTVGANKNQIFIDDQKANAQGFNKLQEATTNLRYGIYFKNPAQLAEEFIKLGILSEIDDKKLLDEIRYPGISGKIKLLTKQTMNYIKTAMS